jgi:beta-barrel assembly-enhancing protease
MYSVLTVCWVISGLFGGLFGGGDGNCRIAEEQAVLTMRQIGAQWPLRAVEDPVSEYVQRLGLRLVRVVDPGLRQPWDFYVLRNTEPSAFAVGGGHFVISDGLIAFTRNESELAAVLAHEISHQSLGHFCRRPPSSEERIDLGTVVQHYDLGAEEDADREAVRLLTAAGFDPRAMLSILRCLDHLPSPTELDLQKRIRALGRQRMSGGDPRYARSAAFGEAQSLVKKDLGNSARPECR